MDLYEYQGKQYFARYGMNVPQGDVTDTVEGAIAIGEKMGFPVAVKAQVLVGGRGKAGGIKIAENAAELEAYSRQILGMDIKGHIVKRLWLQKSPTISKEYYASFTLDRSVRSHLCMVSAKGGIDIEEVAATEPEAIVKTHINPVDGISRETAREIAIKANIDSVAIDKVADALLAMYRCYIEGDADLVEVNPLILTEESEIMALDAKVTLDDAAAFRHPEWAEWQNLEEMDPRDRLAKEKGLQYVGLDGYVGIIANGAGLGMSTCDVVEQAGGKPANFLDIGGGASADVMASALELVNQDPKVKSIFINIFGGITRGEEVANGILLALEKISHTAPIVVRLDGTNAQEGRSILASYKGDNLFAESTMTAAAAKATELADVK